jgi:NosR/NirI family nitrous oxide reductase transcriptional regulator
VQPAAPQPPPDAAAGPRTEPAPQAAPLWQDIWWSRRYEIAMLAAMLIVLAGILIFQNAVTAHGRFYYRLRAGYLIVTFVFLGLIANAQLSVVNVLTFIHALLSGFRWELFLLDPMVFLLWGFVAVSLLFWGRGVFCGWLCPFGALQELTNKVARRLKVPQVTVPWAVHERLWPIKYLIFLGLFGISLYSLTLGEQLAEVEPFKTAIVLRFIRDWPFVLFAVALVGAGLFIERFFCRYLCPLGGALAIPGRMRMFDWLKRYRECGNPCQRCAVECPVQAIRPEGQINVNECIYCMHCQLLYWDDHKCPVVIQRRLKREKRLATTSPSMLPAGADKTSPRRNTEVLS